MITVIAAPLAQAAPNAAAVPTVMSLDFCADQFVLKLAQTDQIISLSPQAGHHFSYMRVHAKDFAKQRTNVENIIASQPDLLIRQWGGGPDAEARFAKRGIRVLTIPPAHDFAGIRSNIRLIAAALGQEKKGRALISEMDAKLEQLRAMTPVDSPALYFTPGGVTAGQKTMVHSIMAAAGLRNIAAEAGALYWPSLSLEKLIAAPPELIVTGYVRDNPDEDINHWSLTRHPALLEILSQVRAIHLGTDSSVCAAWFAADAALDLRAQLNEARP